MNNIIHAMYPGCDKDLNGCFERYIRDRVENMKKHNIHKLKVGTFDNTYDEQFKNIQRDFGDQFWWNPHSWNVGTVKDRYVYSFTLYWMNKSQSKAMHMLDTMVDTMAKHMENMNISPMSNPFNAMPMYGPFMDAREDPNLTSDDLPMLVDLRVDSDEKKDESNESIERVEPVESIEQVEHEELVV